MTATHVAASVSERMRRQRRDGTGPELRVRAALAARGLPFETNVASLPGSPDIVVRPFKLAIFCQGCFWHFHARGCLDGERRLPRRNRAFWARKFERNVERDRAAVASLAAIGWRSIHIWECETKRAACLRAVLDRALGPSPRRL